MNAIFFPTSQRVQGIVAIAFAVMTVLLIVPNQAFAFIYNAYEHYSHANCNADRESVPPTVECDIPTGVDGRKPNNLTGVVVYNRDFEGDVQVCAREVVTGRTLCSTKVASQDDIVIFDTNDLDFNFSFAPWWNWVMYVSFWDTNLGAFQMLKGYKVFFNR